MGLYTVKTLVNNRSDADDMKVYRSFLVALNHGQKWKLAKYISVS